MEVRVVWNRTDGRPSAGVFFINPRKTYSIPCLQFYGKGCASMEGYSVKVGPD
jgi:hypothetical protein